MGLRVRPDGVTLAAVLVSLLTACSAPPAPLSAVPSQDVSVANTERIRIELPAGEVRLEGAEAATLRVSVLVDPGAGDLTLIHRQGDTLLISPLQADGKLWQGPIQLTVVLPHGVGAEIATTTADVVLHGLQGWARVASVAGHVTATEVRGEFSLRSGRGDVTLRDSSGDLALVGEHGVLTIVDSHGEIGASSIMGTIRYTGEPTDGTSVALETDHGPIEVALGPGSNLAFQAETNYGHTACTGMPVSWRGRGCQGVVGGGEASLVVRTVSGAITLRLLAGSP
jgi:hypothetical protein